MAAKQTDIMLTDFDKYLSAAVKTDPGGYFRIYDCGTVEQLV